MPTISVTTSSSTRVTPSSARRRERSMSPRSSTGGARALTLFVGGMALACGGLRVSRGLEAAGAVAPGAAHAVRIAAEAGDQFSAAATGRAGAGIVLGRGAHGLTG